VSALRKSIAVPPDAVEILTEDHNRIKDLFRAFEKLTLANDVNAKKELVEEISNELSIHTQMELEIFYEAARKSLHVHYLLDEAEFEHASMTEISAQLRELDPGDEVYVAKVSLLRAYVNHHFIKEEEAMNLFSVNRNCWWNMDWMSHNHWSGAHQFESLCLS
jgi:Hemerythrin HHE cation binding domain